MSLIVVPLNVLAFTFICYLPPNFLRYSILFPSQSPCSVTQTSDVIIAYFL